MCCIYMYIYKIHVHQKVMERYAHHNILYIIIYRCFSTFTCVLSMYQPRFQLHEGRLHELVKLQAGLL